MEITEIVNECKNRMDKSIQNLKDSLATLRAGTVSPTVLDKIFVKCYGELMSIKEVATIQNSSATSLVVRAFDPSTVKDIEAAIAKSDLGITPNNSGNEIRLNFPPLTGERRQQIIKTSKEYGEQAKVAIRNIRRDMNDIVKKEKDISKDLQKDLENDIQKETDKHVKEIEELLAKKEKEINTI